MRTRHALTCATLGTALALGIMATPAQPAGAAATVTVTCGNANWPHSNIDSGSGRTTTDAAVHTGPYGECLVTGTLSAGAQVSYDCYAVNGYGNTWTWVRDMNGSSIGWVYDAYLDDNGATTHC